MAKLSILAGATSQSVNLFIQNSSSTVGAGLTALSSNTASLVAYYTFQGASAAATAITLSALSSTATAYASGGFIQISSANMPGLYRFDLPNAAIASASGRAVTIMLNGAANMAPCVAEIALIAWDNQVAFSATTIGTVTTVTNQLTASAIAVGVWQDTTAGDFTVANSIGKSVMNGVALGTGLTINAYTGNTAQTGDSFGRIGATGSGLTSIAQSASYTSALAASLVTLAGHDPGTTIGTSTLTQTQVTGGVYSVQASACILGDARIANLDATVSTRMATYTQPTGFLAATFPGGTVANTTNITSGTITTVTGNVGGNVTGSVASVVAAVAITSNRKKAATATFEFLMQDATTGAPKTGLTVAATLSKDGGAAASTSNAVTEIGLGQYQIVLTATEMTANNIFLQATATGALTFNLTVQTQP